MKTLILFLSTFVIMSNASAVDSAQKGRSPIIFFTDKIPTESSVRFENPYVLFEENSGPVVITPEGSRAQARDLCFVLGGEGKLVEFEKTNRGERHNILLIVKSDFADRWMEAGTYRKRGIRSVTCK